MESLDPIYLRILRAGVDAARRASMAGDLDQCAAELEHVHNLPSLIGESNVHRHLYYIVFEKMTYLEAVMQSGRKDWKVFAASVYLPHWREIETILNVDEIRKRGKPGP